MRISSGLDALALAGSLGSFITKTLDHPRDLWQHAFSYQISPLARCVLIALASLPTETDLDGLREATQSICSLYKLQATVFDFNDQLRVLEGSFVRIEASRDLRYCAFSNPSIRDFVLDKIDNDPSVIATILTSVVRFEQCRLLWQRLQLSGSPLALSMKEEPLSMRLWEAFNRTFEAKGAEVVTVRNSQGGDERSRRQESSEDRLSLLLEVGSRLAPLLMTTTVSAHLELLRASWRTQLGSRNMIPGLIKSLKKNLPDEKKLLADTLDCASELLVAGLDSDPNSYTYALDLFDIGGDAYEEARSQLRDKFEEQVDQIAEWIADVVSDYELLRDEAIHLQSLARRIGTDADDAVDWLRSVADDREEAEDRRREEYDEMPSSSGGDEPTASDEQIENLFDSLV
jgi:hypothetical protein